MSRRVRPWFATATLVVLSVLALGSCSLGFLGDTFTLSGQIYYPDKESGVSPTSYGGELVFAMMQPPEELFLTTVTDGSFSAEIGDPDPADMHAWATILPITTPPLEFSNDSATGCVINEIVWDVTVGGTFSAPITRSNVEETVFVYWAYTDSDVTISGTGTYAGPGGTDTMVMDLPLKAGWNRIIMTREGTGPYTDTYKPGNEPEGVYWMYRS